MLSPMKPRNISQNLILKYFFLTKSNEQLQMEYLDKNGVNTKTYFISMKNIKLDLSIHLKNITKNRNYPFSLLLRI